jgi:hypothetical protein
MPAASRGRFATVTVKQRPGGADRPWPAALMLELAERCNGKGSPQKLRQLPTVVVNAALAGDMAEAREVADRIDGKASAFGSEAETTMSFVVRLPAVASPETWFEAIQGDSGPPQDGAIGSRPAGSGSVV